MTTESTATTPAKTPARPTPRRRPWIAAVLMLALGLVLGRTVCAPGTSHAVDQDSRSRSAGDEAATLWTCSMHPQVKMPGPGACPICGMDLIPLVEGPDGLHPRELEISESAAALAGLVTAPVERRAVSRLVRMVGRIAFDETRLSYITAWVPSRLDRLFVDYTGVTVRKGDHLVEVYSPDLIATQQELLAAARSSEMLGGNALDVVRDRQEASVHAARDRLRLWGLTTEQVNEVLERGEPLEQVTINAPVGGVVVHKNAVQGEYVETGTRLFTIADLTRVWVRLDAYESDLAWLHYGQRVEFITEAYPGETFHGRISFIDPVLDDRTRTVKLRVIVDNEELRLKPDMFVRATVQAPLTATGRVVDLELAGKWMCPMHPEIVRSRVGECPLCGMDLVPTSELGYEDPAPEELPLVIPDTAPLVTGARAVVYVRLPGDGPPVFEGREVVLGPRAEGVYVVREGLRVGEQVVVKGAFKLDSELQIRARPSMMSPDGGMPVEHLHGGHAGLARPAAPHVVMDIDAPDGFREALAQAAAPLMDASHALAADDATSARRAGDAFGQALRSIPTAELSTTTTDWWQPVAARLEDAARRLTSSPDMRSLRAALNDAHRAYIAAADSVGWPDGHAAPGIFHCPMAFDGLGADWIGDGPEVLNPYYGAAMLTCGERIRDVAER